MKETHDTDLHEQILDICADAKGREGELVAALGAGIVAVIFEWCPDSQEAKYRIEKITNWIREHADMVLAAKH